MNSCHLQISRHPLRGRPKSNKLDVHVSCMCFTAEAICFEVFWFTGMWLVRVIQYLGLHATMTHLITVISCSPFLLYLRFAFCKTMLVHQLRPEDKIILPANGRPSYNCCFFFCRNKYVV